jgi:energy-coupling factor transporter ATP-binding protein EcfA2
MALAQLKYNPGIHGDEELIESFVVRHQALELVLETLRENTDNSNQHLLIVGPRGSGKTTLVRRVAAEVRSDPVLDALWYPLVFAEESYMVSSPGEFWLEALFHLGDQTGNSRWNSAYQELRTESDEGRLRQRALAQLMDFAQETGKRILLVVENLNMLLGEQIDESAGWDLRHPLSNEPRIMLLGTATTRFEEIKNIDKAWFELLSIHELEPLDAEECGALWQAATREAPDANKLRPIQILTGGNPRLLRILAEFATGKSFRELMSQLVHLIDEHTEYFKSHLDNLAPKERKVFVALLDIWDPASAKEVAEAARMSTNQVSTLLNRLVGRGAVQIVHEQGRQKIYQAAERLFNIYYLMRRRGHPSNRVRAAVAFMIQFYEPEDLVRATTQLAHEATTLPQDERHDHYRAFQEIVQGANNPILQAEILQSVPEGFFDSPDIPETVRALHKQWMSVRAGPFSEEHNKERIETTTSSAQAWARFYVWACLHYGRFLIEKGAWDDLSALAEALLDEAAYRPEAVDAAVDLVVEIAASGRVEKILQQILDSKGARVLEPLAVGLRIYSGENLQVAREILEIGRDVAKLIGERATELAKEAQTGSRPS